MKKGSTSGVFILLLLFIILGISLYFLYLNFPREPVVLKEIVNPGNEEIIEYSSSEQFYKSMRYKDKSISYFISPSCDEEKRQDMVDAFLILEEKTILDFVLDSENAEINVLCSDVAPEVGQEDYFVAGEGGPSEIINSTLYSVILKGKISLFRNDRCDKSKVAVHELLHALGFNHNQNPKSILYPTLNCEQEIDEETLRDIDKLYSVEPKPDFEIFKVEASKGGRYLNFDIEVINQGLVDADNVKLTVYSRDRKVEDFELNEIKIGARKILNVNNLKLPFSDKKVKFVIDDENDIPELFENNNVVELVLDS